MDDGRWRDDVVKGQEPPSELAGSISESTEKPRWPLIALVTLLGAAGLFSAWRLKPDDVPGFGQNALIELSGAVVLAGVLLLLERAMMREVRRTVRTELGRQKAQEDSSGLKEALRNAAKQAGATSDTVARLGRAEVGRAAAMASFGSLLMEVQSELESGDLGLSSSLIHGLPEGHHVLGWHPNNYQHGEMSKQVPPCTGSVEGSDQGWRLEVQAAVAGRVSWTIAAASRLCGDGLLTFAVGCILSPINPKGADSDVITNRFMNEQLDRQVGYRKAYQIKPDMSDLETAVAAASDQLRAWIPLCLEKFYELTEWTATFEEYSW
jgi:hypothetical protein